ncbi:hypothetical protein [Curtobacterium flaccumfaciens]|uniref:hypothetical protein n=1 Tax=Curtobacterium flaccumfaciens TaxID=2035 RepID=UPI0013EFEF7E|nr:hypothetical protein [Curtobacterium flaccumfaciens]QIH95689.1 hypothetical protein GBG65_21235 [Curtobacterium flaccumfaciens pv. flaccumfaciens]
MTSTQSMEEARELRSTDGDELGAVCHSSSKVDRKPHMVWQQYRQLFGSNKETVVLLNRTASLFFKIVQDEIWG